MSGIAILAVGLAALLALRPPRVQDDPGVGLLAFVLAAALTVAADRALFGPRRRAFWLGFTATGWLCAAAALVFLQETRDYLFEYGPPLVRARRELQQQHAAAARALVIGVDDLETPQVSEWYFLSSLLAEVGLGLAVGLLIASAGGLMAAAVALVARRAAEFLQR
jgi:MFS family permease